MRILIADDEPGVRSLVRMTLGADHHQILEAENGEEALAVARDQQPHLIFLDVEMPGPSGYEVCRALKRDSHTAAIRVVMLTARAQESDREEGEGAGADGYFTKPFSPVALLDKVDQVVAGREAS